MWIEFKNVRMREIYCTKWKKYKALNITYLLWNITFSSICDKYGTKDENIFKDKDTSRILTFFGLITNIEGY